jgi:hypothetical protein
MNPVNRFVSWKYSYLILFGLIALLILGKLLFPGFILTLDMVFTPSAGHEDVFYGWLEDQNGYRPSSLTETPRLPYYVVIYLLNSILPMWAIQKLILFLILFVAGIAAYHLCPAKGPYGKYFAGLLYMINPFTYVRFLAGHYQLLLAYAITPFAVKAVVDAFDSGSKDNIIKAALWITLVGIINLHNLLLVLLLFGLFLIVHVIHKWRNTEQIVELLRTTALVTGIFVMANLYWLLPLLTEETTLAQIGASDIAAFAPKPLSNFNIGFTIASMYGFWRSGYTYVPDLLTFWYLLFIFMLCFVILGAVTTVRDKQRGRSTQVFILAIIVALILGIGAASPFTEPIFNWLFEHFFIFKGFRDSQKFVALLVLAYAYLGGVGLDAPAKYLKEERVRRAIAIVVIIAALVTPPLYSYTMFEFHEQLRPMDYPQGWYEANELLNQDSDEFNVLFFPWHLYMTFSWSKRRIANPAAQFFDKPVLQGDNIEVRGIYSESPHPASQYLEFLLKNPGYTNFGELVAPLNVKYIILAREVDYKQYQFLYNQDDLRVVLENEDLIVFRNEHETAKLYEVDHAYAIRDWNELIQRSKTEDITNALFLIEDSGTASSGHEQSEKRILNYSKKSSVEYDLEGTPTKKYLIFTTTYAQDWDYEGHSPLNNMGLTNAFETDSVTDGKIKYGRFRVYALGYGISAAFLSFLVGFYLFRR